MRHGEKQRKLDDRPFGEMPDALCGIEPKAFDQFATKLIVPSRIERATEGNGLGNTHPAVNKVLLGHIADARLDVYAVHCGVEAENINVAAIPSDESHQCLDRRGLPRAVGTEETQYLAFSEFD